MYIAVVYVGYRNNYVELFLLQKIHNKDKTIISHLFKATTCAAFVVISLKVSTMKPLCQIYLYSQGCNLYLLHFLYLVLVKTVQ